MSKIQQRTRINLGKQKNTGSTNMKPLDKGQLLLELQSYLTFKKRYAKSNIKNITKAASLLMDRYDLTLISQEKAQEIEQDMMQRGLKSFTVIHALEALEHLSACRGITGEDDSPLKFSKPKLIKLERKSLSLLEARALLDACLTVRDRALISVLLYSGIRAKELLQLRIGDVDLKQRLLYIRVHDNEEIIKNRRERRSLLTREATDLLGEWVMLRPSVKCDHLFLNTYGEPLGRSGLAQIVREAGKRAGITDKNVFPHLCRHTAATTMLKSGIPITEVALQLGHRNLSSTMVYLHGDLEGLKDSIDKKFVY